MLHSLRRRLQQTAEAEARGDSFWTSAFSARARTRVLHVVTKIGTNSTFGSLDQVFDEARAMILEQEGLFFLKEQRIRPQHDFFQYYQACADDMFPTVVEALIPALDSLDKTDSPHSSGWRNGYVQSFVEAANEIFAQERVGWELIDGLMVEIHSKELHEAAIEPALRLLHNREFAKADRAYRDALDELAHGKGADAITDAGTALQEILTALGCDGNQLGDLIRSAKNKGLIAGHDTPVFDAIEKTLHWVAADRSQSGDPHHVSEATREDAWLIVHVVGAFIVRLASGEKRK